MAATASCGALWYAILVVLLLVLLGIVIYGVWFSPVAQQAAANGAATSNARTIDVEGTASVTAVPDIATVVLGVETQAATVDEAAQRNTAAVEAVVRAVTPLLAAPERDLQTTSYTVTPVFDSSPPSNLSASQQAPPTANGNAALQPPVGFRVSHQIVARVQGGPDVGAAASRILAAATLAGATSVSGPALSVSPQSPAFAAARTMAVRDAQRRAAELAQLNSVALGPLQRMSESSFVDVGPSLAVARQTDAPPPIQTGASTVTYRVSASYGIGAQTSA